MKYTRILLEEIRSGIYSSLSMLPPEIEIAQHFSVSRTMIRDCLATLDREGFISRRRGLGTVINHHVLRVKTRIDLEKEFLDIVRDEGYEPKRVSLGASLARADNHLSEQMEIEEGSTVLRAEHVVWASDQPAIYCIDYIPGRLFEGQNIKEEIFQRPIFEFLKEICGEDVYMDLSEIYAIGAEGEVAKQLELKEGTPILHLRERGYSFDGKIVLYSDEYYRQGRIVHTILRKKI